MSQQDTVYAPPSTGNVAVYAVQGMTCKGCAGLLRDELLRVPGVEHVDVSYEAAQAKVHWRGQRAADEVVAAAGEQVGLTLSRLPRPESHFKEAEQ
jgi:copper chaperone CopZ